MRVGLGVSAFFFYATATTDPHSLPLPASFHTCRVSPWRLGDLEAAPIGARQIWPPENGGRAANSRRYGRHRRCPSLVIERSTLWSALCISDLPPSLDQKGIRRNGEE